MDARGIGLVVSLVSGSALMFAGCQPQDEAAVADPVQAQQETRAAWVDASRVANADAEPENWLVHGRTNSEQRFSPLDLVNDGNVDELGLAWYTDLDTNRGQEATPIVVDGVLYSTSAWSKVQAVDAKTGRLLWHYDPEVAGYKIAVQPFGKGAYISVRWTDG